MEIRHRDAETRLELAIAHERSTALRERSECAALRAVVERVKAEALQAGAQVVASEQAMAALRATWSWRLTGPLRMLRALARREAARLRG